VLLVTPYYSKPGQAGTLQHFRTVAESSDLPVMLYDVPGRTATRIELPTYVAARDVSNIIPSRTRPGTSPRTAVLTELGYAVYSGDDAAVLGFLAHGACGLVSVVGHAAGEQLAGLIRAFLSGDHAAALATYRSLVPAMEAVMGVPNYGATTAKAALQLLGVLPNRNVRGPLVPLDDAEVEALRAGLAASDLL
jgi:4-hydroxy-tetrahydrodipicolinate synthase